MAGGKAKKTQRRPETHDFRKFQPGHGITSRQSSCQSGIPALPRCQGLIIITSQVEAISPSMHSAKTP